MCDIFADEVLKGNRENTHLSKTGYKNVIQRFKDRTGIQYNKRQFKNKWDKLKGEYAVWKKLPTSRQALDGMQGERILTCQRVGGSICQK